MSEPDMAWINAQGFCRTCDHAEVAHQHYREGTDCSVTDCDCRRFRGHGPVYTFTRGKFWAVMLLAGYGVANLVGQAYDLLSKLGG
jgi:hypothetical protein